MEGISDIKIIGIDEMRPPRIRKEPYINLFFKLHHKAPKDWCEEFNHLVAKRQYPIKIEPAGGQFIETWVRKPDEIEHALDGLKEAVRQCNQEYIARILAEANATAEMDDNPTDTGEQGNLNRIVAGLNYE
ncbi:MAG: hypothetical protein WBO73_05225 [Gammaproteobacteria bacterium]